MIFFSTISTYHFISFENLDKVVLIMFSPLPSLILFIRKSFLMIKEKKKANEAQWKNTYKGIRTSLGDTSFMVRYYRHDYRYDICTCLVIYSHTRRKNISLSQLGAIFRTYTETAPRKKIKVGKKKLHQNDVVRYLRDSFICSKCRLCIFFGVFDERDTQQGKLTLGDGVLRRQ